MYHFNDYIIYYRSDLVIPGTKSSLYVEEIFEFSDILYGTDLLSSLVRNVISSVKIVPKSFCDLIL